MPTREQRREAVEGWKGRILSKLAFGAGTGVVVGSLLAVLNNTPLVRNTATSTASFMIVLGVFSTMQETARLARCADSPANSAIAGAGTGAFLYKIHGNRPAVGAVLCSALASSLHWAADRVDLSHGLRGALISMDLLDDDSPPDTPPNAKAGPKKGGGWFARIAPYLPIRKFSDEEWEEYQRSQDELQRKRIQVALEGGLPVMVERRRQQAEEEQQRQQPESQAQQPSSSSSSNKLSK